jgi:hypothetical protein
MRISKLNTKLEFATRRILNLNINLKFAIMKKAVLNMNALGIKIREIKLKIVMLQEKSID